MQVERHSCAPADGNTGRAAFKEDVIAAKAGAQCCESAGGKTICKEILRSRQTCKYCCKAGDVHNYLLTDEPPPILAIKYSQFPRIEGAGAHLRFKGGQRCRKSEERQ